MSSNRFNDEFYIRRMKNNLLIKKFLVNKIVEHGNIENQFSIDELMIGLNSEDLLERAIAHVNKDIRITLGAGKDFCDRSDAKLVITQYRNNSVRKGTWTHSGMITGIGNKEGDLRVCMLNSLTEEFHFFHIPHRLYNHLGMIEIVFDRVSNCFEDPKLTGEPKKHYKWWDRQCSSFEEMCLKRTI